MKLKKDFLCLLIFLGLLIYLFGDKLLPPAGKMIAGSDIYGAYYYLKYFLQENIRNFNLPFWNPYNFSGTPFLAHPNINIFYPPNWLFIFFPLNISFSLYFFLHMLIAGVSMYVCIRNVAGRWGGFAGAVAFALGGFYVARIYSGHLEYV